MLNQEAYETFYMKSTFQHSFVRYVSQIICGTAEESYQTSPISFSLCISSRKYSEVNSQDAQECYNHLQKSFSST